MKTDEMKIQYERERDGFERESAFAVSEGKPQVKVDASGIVIKISLCAAVLALAIIVRAFGVGKPDTGVVSASSVADPSASDPQGEEAIGTLRYVDAASVLKWTAPVLSNDIELLRDGQLLRFTALSGTVNACMAGKVLSVETDEQLGKTVRIQSENDCETVYYGFETVDVRQNATVAQGDALGTVQPGRSIYLRVFEQGQPQDPTAYVDLSLRNE